MSVRFEKVACFEFRSREYYIGSKYLFVSYLSVSE